MPSQPSQGESSPCSDMSSFEEPPSPLSVASSGPPGPPNEPGPDQEDLRGRELPLLPQHFLPCDPTKWNVEEVYEFIRSLPGKWCHLQLTAGIALCANCGKRHETGLDGKCVIGKCHLLWVTTDIALCVCTGKEVLMCISCGSAHIVCQPLSCVGQSNAPVIPVQHDVSYASSFFLLFTYYFT